MNDIAELMFTREFTEGIRTVKESARISLDYERMKGMSPGELVQELKNAIMVEWQDIKMPQPNTTNIVKAPVTKPPSSEAMDGTDKTPMPKPNTVSVFGDEGRKWQSSFEVAFICAAASLFGTIIVWFVYLHLQVK